MAIFGPAGAGKSFVNKGTARIAVKLSGRSRSVLW
jgi:hypothetical protein